MSKFIGGSAYGRGDAIIDVEGSVLFDTVTAALVGVGQQTGVETCIAVELGGRINHDTERSEVLYLMNADGAAALVSEILGVAQRIGPHFLEHLMQRIADLP